MEDDLGYCMLTRRIHCNKVCGVLIDNYMVEFEYQSVVMNMSVILHCLTPCPHYLLQNFRITVVFSFCDNIWGTPCLVLNFTIL